MKKFTLDAETEARVRKNISDCISNLAEHKDAIEVITLTRGYKSIQKLSDDDWTRFSRMNIAMRPAFEKVINTPEIIDLLKLRFGESRDN